MKINKADIELVKKASKKSAEEIRAKLGFLADGSDAAIYLRAFLQAHTEKGSPLDILKIVVATALAQMLDNKEK